MKKYILKDFLLKLSLFLNIISAIGIPCLGYYISEISYFYFIICISTFVMFLFLRKKFLLKGFIKYIFIYYLIIILSTLVSNGDLYLLLCETVINLTTILIWNSFNKDEFREYLPVLVFALEVLTYINFIIILRFPDGLFNQGFIRKYFLFGHVNIAIRYLLPGCCFNLIRTYMYNNKIDKRCFVYLIIVFLTLIITWPVTAILGFTIFIFSFLLMRKNIRFTNILSPINTMLVSAFSTYMIIYVKIQDLFASLISNILHKDLTFSGRTDIWDTAIAYIKKSPFYGYGRLTSSERTEVFNATSAHNQYLNFLFEGGVFMVILISISLISTSLKLKKCSNKAIKSILCATIVSYLFMWIAEPFSYSGTLLMFIIWMFAYNSKRIIDGD